MTDSTGASLVYQQNFYHQRPRKTPLVLGNGTFAFVRHLRSDSSSDIGEIEVEHEWVTIPHRVKSPGMMILRNCEGQFYELQPSEEQLREDQERVLEVSFHDWDRPALEIPVGEQQPITPSNGTIVKVRSRSGRVRVQFMVVPK